MRIAVVAFRTLRVTARRQLPESEYSVFRPGPRMLATAWFAVDAVVGEGGVVAPATDSGETSIDPRGE